MQLTDVRRIQSSASLRGASRLSNGLQIFELIYAAKLLTFAMSAQALRALVTTMRDDRMIWWASEPANGSATEVPQWRGMPQE